MEATLDTGMRAGTAADMWIRDDEEAAKLLEEAEETIFDVADELGGPLKKEASTADKERFNRLTAALDLVWVVRSHLEERK